MEKKIYKAFTLIEMLIVMGIIMILIGVGVAGTRYALNSANKIKLQNAVDNLNQAVMSYFADNREYPSLDSGFSGGLIAGGEINEYMEQGEFDGGADATYYYWVDDTNQSFLVCVSLGGHLDTTELGFYCNGNGFGTDSTVTDQNIEGADGRVHPATNNAGWSNENWTNETNSWSDFVQN